MCLPEALEHAGSAARPSARFVPNESNDHRSLVSRKGREFPDFAISLAIGLGRRRGG